MPEARGGWGNKRMDRSTLRPFLGHSSSPVQTINEQKGSAPGISLVSTKAMKKRGSGVLSIIDRAGPKLGSCFTASSAPTAYLEWTLSPTMASSLSPVEFQICMEAKQCAVNTGRWLILLQIHTYTLCCQWTSELSRCFCGVGVLPRYCDSFKFPAWKLRGYRAGGC